MRIRGSSRRGGEKTAFGKRVAGNFGGREMKKKSCVGWESFPGWMHKIDTDSLGNATGCHLKDGSQSWYCSECRYKDGGEMKK